jgi:hypothetical protein
MRVHDALRVSYADLKKKLIVGEEYDEALRHAVMAELAALGATIEAQQWGLGGSQIIHTTKLRLGKDTLVVESETYVGLSLSGPARVVDRVVDRVASSLPTRVAKP